MNLTADSSMDPSYHRFKSSHLDLHVLERSNSLPADKECRIYVAHRLPFSSLIQQNKQGTIKPFILQQSDVSEITDSRGMEGGIWQRDCFLELLSQRPKAHSDLVVTVSIRY